MTASFRSSNKDGGHPAPLRAGINHMKVVENPPAHARPWVISVLTIGIFVFDMLTPVGVLISAFYIFPLLLAFLSLRERDLIYFSIIATALTWINLFLEPPGISIPFGVLNRVIGTLVLWGIAMGLIHIRRVEEGLTNAEGALKTARGQFKDIFEASKDAIGYVALDGTILLVNQAFSKMTGFSREELLRMNVRGLIPEQHKEQRDRVVAQAFQASEPVEYEMHYFRKDGSQIPVSITKFVVKEDDGKPAGIAVIVRNLTEHKRAGGEFRLVVEASPNGMLMVDEDGTILLVNQQVEQLFGYERAELIGQPVEMLVPQRMRSHHAGDREKFFAHSESRAMGKGRDLYGVRKNGQEFPLEIGLNPVRTPDGLRVLASVVDIGARKRAERALQKERDFIDAVLETAGALVVVLDREGQILRFNRTCEETTGYSSEEVMGRHVWDLFIIPDEVAGVKAVFERLRGGEPRSDYENYWRGKDGFLRRISWSNTVIVDSSGKVDYVVSSGLDITDFQSIQEQLRKTERIAELGTLASGMAHEIGTPMNVILGRAEYLLQRTADEGMKKGLATIVTQIERITKVMNQLLIFARRKQPDRQAVDLGEIVEDSLEMFQERMPHNRITVEKVIEGNLPSIHADRDQLVQVLINLVTNSLHAMPEGGRLRLSLDRENKYVRLGISDTGHGMPEEVRSKIFEPFFTTKDFGKGTGLGLTVVKGIIEEHGGTIAVESVVDKGTTFWIRLPIEEAQAASVKREA
jgi:PAS domain S-box-containing protein